MQHYGDNFIPVVPEENLLHTQGNPFCYNDTCGCYEDEALLTEVMEAYTQGLLTSEEATHMVAGRMV